MNNKKAVLIISLFFIITVSISISYAFFSYKNSTTPLTFESNIPNISLEFDEGINMFTTENLYPLSDELGSISKPYYFRIRNSVPNANQNYVYSVEIEELGGNIDNSDIRVKVDYNNDLGNYSYPVRSIGDLSINPVTGNRMLTDEKCFLGNQNYGLYSFRIWLDSDYENNKEKSYVFKISVYVRLENEEDTLCN